MTVKIELTQLEVDALTGFIGWLLENNHDTALESVYYKLTD